MNPFTPAQWFQRGLERDASGDAATALEAFLQAFRLNPRDPRHALFAGAALAAAGRAKDAVVVFSMGDDVDPQMRKLGHRPDIADAVRTRSQLADRMMREHFTRLHQTAMDEVQRMLGPEADVSRVRNAIWPQTHDAEFVYRTPKHAPDIFYMPNLPARTITPRELLPWAAAVEKAVNIVLEEYLAAVRSGMEFSPYVHPYTRSPTWRELRGNMDWSSLHLYSQAQETPLAQHFSRTLDALKGADVVRVRGGRPIEMFFSRLKPGTHIPPHHGAANSRVTVHLPLIIPEDCSIRVGDDLHSWRMGEIFAFDDSFEHEAWNRSDSERVVLIFEAHHPDLSQDERRAIEHCFQAREDWRRARQPP